MSIEHSTEITTDMPWIDLLSSALGDPLEINDSEANIGFVKKDEVAVFPFLNDNSPHFLTIYKVFLGDRESNFVAFISEGAIDWESMQDIHEFVPVQKITVDGENGIVVLTGTNFKNEITTARITRDAYEY